MGRKEKVCRPPRKVRGQHAVGAREKQVFLRDDEGKPLVYCDGPGDLVRALLTVRAGNEWQTVMAAYVTSAKRISRTGDTETWDCSFRAVIIEELLCSPVVLAHENIMSGGAPRAASPGMITPKLNARDSARPKAETRREQFRQCSSSTGRILSTISKRNHKSRLRESLGENQEAMQPGIHPRLQAVLSVNDAVPATNKGADPVRAWHKATMERLQGIVITDPVRGGKSIPLVSKNALKVFGKTIPASEKFANKHG